MFRGLGPFTGGARLEAIESIFANLDAAPVETVAALLDQSLLRRRDDPDGQPRFWMLDTIRHHALERLRVDGEADAAANRHAAYFAQLAVRAERHSHTAEQSAWLQRLEADHDNLRAAFDHLLIVEPSEALRLGAALGFFWEIRGHISDGRERLRRALSAVSPKGAPGAKATYFAGRLAFLQGENERATPLFREALRLARQADDVEVQVQAMTHLGILTERRGDRGGGVEPLEQALAIARGRTNDWALRVALNNLGTLLAETGQTERARTLLDEALLLARRIGEPFGLALTAGNLAELALARGDTHAAEALIAECLDSAREIGYASSIGWALSLHTLLALHRGELDTAEARNQEALKSLRVGYDASTGPIALAAGATLAAARREPLLAARLWAALDRDIRTHHVEEAAHHPNSRRVAAQNTGRGRPRGMGRSVGSRRDAHPRTGARTPNNNMSAGEASDTDARGDSGLRALTNGVTCLGHREIIKLNGLQHQRRAGRRRRLRSERHLGPCGSLLDPASADCRPAVDGPGCAPGVPR